jgi:hypothetical protein
MKKFMYLKYASTPRFATRLATSSRPAARVRHALEVDPTWKSMVAVASIRNVNRQSHQL